MKTILEVVSLIQDGRIHTGNIVQIHSDDSMSIRESFANSEKVLNIHIGFNTLDATHDDLTTHVTAAFKYSVALRQRYFPQ